MKKTSIFLVAALMPMFAMGSLRTDRTAQAVSGIPAQYSVTGETRTLEWGCPIDNEVVEAENRKSALNRLISECIDQASRAAQSKPDVAAVIQASVIAPDLAFHERSKGLHVVNGTIFLETVVSMVRSGR